MIWGKGQMELNLRWVQRRLMPVVEVFTIVVLATILGLPAMWCAIMLIKAIR